MHENSPKVIRNVEQMRVPKRSTMISDELRKIQDAVRAICPTDAAIKFDFESKLQISIDIRKLEDLVLVETILPTLCGGLFTNVQRRMVENRSFRHRLTALVDR